MSRCSSARRANWSADPATAGVYPTRCLRYPEVMDLFRGQPIRLQPYFGYRSDEKLVITARALRAGKPGFEKRGRLQAMRTMVAQFASREVVGLAVRLEIKSPEGVTAEHHGVTDHEGYIRFEMDLVGDWPCPVDPAWEIVCIHWLNRDGAQCVEGFVLVPGTKTVLGIISDIDDTIVETGITGGPRQIARNWRRVLAELPDERIVVPGADVFYGAIGGGAVLPGNELHVGERLAATHRPFFYVSSSPWNLFSYLVAFIKSRNLPLGPLLLRDWGFDRATFGSESHGAHKRGAVDAVLALYPSMRFALIGDDTQGDLTAYSEVVQANPGRIAAVFIRTGAGPLSPAERGGKAMIEAAGVPLWLGGDYATGRDFLRANKLSTTGETSQIVETVRNADKAA